MANVSLNDVLASRDRLAKARQRLMESEVWAECEAAKLEARKLLSQYRKQRKEEEKQRWKRVMGRQT